MGASSEARTPPPARLRPAPALAALLLPASASAESCWAECSRTRLYCPEFCCQPLDGIGNPSCWDTARYFTYARCCGGLSEPVEPARPPSLLLGSVNLTLYRGPSDHNSPRINERTIEIALGLWFMRRRLEDIRAEGGGSAPVEVGNVMGSYWPPGERIDGLYLPWQLVDVTDNGLDATAMSYHNLSVLSISTVEHIGYDNEGARHLDGFRSDSSPEGLEAWAAAWADAASTLERIVREASHFLVTFPIGVNPRLDAVVASEPQLRRLARVARRVDALNRWEVDPDASFSYWYDFRDTYDEQSVGHMFHPGLPAAYERVYGQPMPPRLPLPLHPRFRFANAICIVTNMPELLA